MGENGDLKDLGNLSILIVEDNDDDAYFIKNALKKESWQTTRINNGRDGLDFILKNYDKIDVVLLDYKLPFMDGFEIMDHISEHDIDVPIIFLTIDSSIGTAIEAMKHGALDFLPKFGNYEKLALMVEKVCRIGRNRHEKKLLEKALEKSEKKYRSIFENIQDIYFEQALDGTILEISPSVINILYFSREELVGTNVQYFYSNKNEHPNFVSRLMSEGHVNQYEIPFRSKSGGVVACSINAKIVGEAGTLTQKIVGTIRDISEYRQLQDMFRQSQKMEAIGRLAGGIAHDFNNMLNVVMNASQLVKMKIEDRNYVIDKLDTIIQVSESAAKLTKELLVFSKKNVVSKEMIDLGQYIKSLQKMLERLLGEDIKLQINESPVSAWMEIDSIHIEQVVMNLVTNARDAMPEGGELMISVYQTACTEENRIKNLPVGLYNVLSVKDTGTGMTDEVIEHIFEPFYTTKEHRGTGLGLSTVYGIVQQTGGAIDVYSKFGYGTDFVIYFPASDKPSKAVDTPVQIDNLPHGTETILLVEDDHTVRNIVGQMLTHLGYKVVECEMPSKAMMAVSEDNLKVDLLLTDVIMPGMNGVELAKWVRRLHPSMPVLFMSGYSDKKILDDTIISTENNYIKKPFRIEILSAKIREILK